MSYLSDTEKRLANVWKEILFLSEKEVQNLACDSNFFDLIKHFCTTIEIAGLQSEICREFGVDSNEIGKLEPDSTLKEQADWIDNHLQSTAE